MITNATIPELNQALNLTNKVFDDNIRFKHIGQKGRRVSFTLTVNSTKKKGHRISHTGRKIAAACYCAHKELMVNLFKINPNCYISSWMARYDSLNDLLANCGEARYKNVGSQCQPIDYGDACEC